MHVVMSILLHLSKNNNELVKVFMGRNIKMDLNVSMQRHKKVRYSFLILFMLTVSSLYSAKVGLLSVATGRYINFIPSLVKSVQEHFLKDHEVHVIVFTDGKINPLPNVKTVFQKRMGWPHDTLLRFEVYLKSQSLFNDFDYLFACDADMLFASEVTGEILGERVGTLHCGFAELEKDLKKGDKSRFVYNESTQFFEARGTYDTNPKSTAFIRPDEGEHYFAGGFWGASRAEFFKLCDTVLKRIKQDFEQDYIALWHDESQLNRYFIDNPPSVILPPSYCYPEHLKKSYEKKLIAIWKDYYGDYSKK